MRALHLSVRLLVVAIAVAPFLSLHAESNSASGAPTSAAHASAAKPALKKLNLDDYSGWNRIGAAALSRDGKWMTFTYTPNEGGDPVLHVKSLDGDKDYVTSLGAMAGGGGRAGGGRGGAPGGGGAPSISDDAHWAAYMVNPPGRAGGNAGRGRGAPTPGGRGVGQGAQTPAPAGHLELLNLATGEKSSITNAGSWKFSATSRWIAVRFNRPHAAAAAGAAGGSAAVAAPTSNGADLILRDLTTGADIAIGNVNQYEFDDSGKLFAYTVDAAQKFGNGVYVLRS